MCLDLNQSRTRLRRWRTWRMCRTLLGTFGRRALRLMPFRARRSDIADRFHVAGLRVPGLRRSHVAGLRGVHRSTFLARFTLRRTRLGWAFVVAAVLAWLTVLTNRTPFGSVTTAATTPTPPATTAAFAARLILSRLSLILGYLPASSRLLWWHVLLRWLLLWRTILALLFL
jgi:hypothetical protein